MFVSNLEFCWCEKKLYNMPILPSNIWGENFTKKKKTKNTRAT